MEPTTTRPSAAPRTLWSYFDLSVDSAVTSGVISKARTPSSKQNTVCRPTRHDTTNTNYIQFFKALMGLVVMYSGSYGKSPD